MSPIELLTPREREVLDLRAMGKSRKEIAYTLGISAATVRNHMQAIYAKLEVDNILDALRAVGRLV